MRSVRQPLRTLTILAVFALAFLPAVAAKKKFEASYRGSIFSEFTDNLFHLSKDQIGEFGVEQAPGEQFFDMDDPEDVVTRMRLRADLTWRLDKRRDFRMTFRGAYDAHLENSVSDHPRLDLKLRHDVTRHDRIYGGIDLVLDRFWKNYRVANSATFAPASYDQAVVHLGYERKVNKHWTVGGEYRNQNRDYDAPLESRDRDGDYLAAVASYDVTDRTTGETWLHYGDVATPVEVDNGIPEDRSYTEWAVGQGFRFRPSKRTRVGLELQLRQRDATTDFTQDLARFDRVDRRSRVRVSVQRELGNRLSIEGRATYTDNDSDRLDPAILTDEVGYDETSLGLGLRYEF